MKNSGKLFADWYLLKQSEAYLSELSSVMGIPIAGLIQSIAGSNPYL